LVQPVHPALTALMARKVRLARKVPPVLKVRLAQPALIRQSQVLPAPPVHKAQLARE